MDPIFLKDSGKFLMWAAVKKITTSNKAEKFPWGSNFWHIHLPCNTANI